jgi:phosphatidylinositol-3-phosphatase
VHSFTVLTPNAQAPRIPGRSIGAPILICLAMLGLPGAQAKAASVPAFDHIYLIVMENHDFGTIVGSERAPYLNKLIGRYGLSARYRAIRHPSQPNYLALFGGSTFGVRDDGHHNRSQTNLVDQLEAVGKSWRVYAQDYPGGCSQVDSYKGSSVDLVGLRGRYVRKHNAALTFTDISHDAARCARITDLSGFSASAADFELIIPNQMNDMHDGTIAQGDRFLKSFVPRITSDAAFASSLLLITWDEGSELHTGDGGHVATIVISPLSRPGFRSRKRHDHYSLLRTIETAWGLPCMRHTCSANDLREFFAP